MQGARGLLAAGRGQRGSPSAPGLIPAASAWACTLQDGETGTSEEVRILFSACKGETHTHKQGFKQLFRRLRSTYRPDKIESKDDFNMDTLRSAHVLVFGGPKEKFTATEVEMLKKFVKGGGSVLVLMSEGGEERAGTNINYFLEQFGMSVNNDAVVRTTHYKYLHPKEVLISDGILNRSVITGAGKSLNAAANEDDEFRVHKGPQAFDGTGMEYVYPYGATISVQKPSVPILSSGKIAYPMNRPVGAVWSQPGFGRIAVVGSCMMFDDKWLDKEENSKVLDFLFKFLKPVRRGADSRQAQASALVMRMYVRRGVGGVLHGALALSLCAACMHACMHGCGRDLLPRGAQAARPTDWPTRWPPVSMCPWAARGCGAVAGGRWPSAGARGPWSGAMVRSPLCINAASGACGKQPFTRCRRPTTICTSRTPR